MPTPILATKLHIQPLRPQVVLRPRLVERLNAGLHRKLTLISAPAGFGKTTLISEWIAGCERPAAWLSLDDGENDPTRFVTYLIAALQTMAAHIGAEVEVALHSAQPPPIASLLTTLLNDITTIPDPFVLVLDDYHLVGAQSVDQALTFLLEHLPQKMHLVIATREDPHLPLARLRARNQLTEIRAKDLRFTPSEAGEFLVQVMGLTLSAEDVAALERRTEGWIAGLQLAAISLQGQHDATRFITSFTGSHHFVVDYLVEEVLRQQSPSVQTFLLHTSILDRLCGSLCDAVVLDPSRPGQETLEYLERANLFVVPLDNERRWYRYHHLFADVLRQRLHQGIASSSKGEEDVSKFHRRASVWYEGHGLELEAFTHAAASQDVERATRLLEGNGMPLHFRGGVIPVLHWLKSLPSTVLDASPALWVMYASALSAAGQNTGIEEKLQAAEAALPAVPLDDTTRNLVGHIAAIRATLAANNYQVETIITQSHRALEYLHPETLMPALLLVLRWDMRTSSREIEPRPAGPTPTPLLSVRRPGIASSRLWRQSVWATYRKRILSFIWRLQPTSMPWTCLVSRRCQLPARRIWAWPASATNGTTWGLPSSTGTRASTWRGKSKIWTDGLPVKCFSPV